MGAKISIDKESMLHEQLLHCCRYGFLDNLHQLYSENPQIDLSRNEEEAFRLACEVGEIYIIRQLREWNPKMDIGAKNYLGLCSAICVGHVDVIKQIFAWDIQIEPLKFIDFAFHNSTIELLKELHNRRQKIQWITHSILNIEDIECPICQEIPSDYIWTPCNHKFCQGCIITWFEINQSCPYCRENL